MAQWVSNYSIDTYDSCPVWTEGKAKWSFSEGCAYELWFNVEDVDNTVYNAVVHSDVTSGAATWENRWDVPYFISYCLPQVIDHAYSTWVTIKVAGSIVLTSQQQLISMTSGPHTECVPVQTFMT